ncbi:MAG: apolipoprotein N-acyltransferase [Vicinamibacterales bacterium]
MTYFLALVSGALLALSFPRYGHPAFGWVALVPLLLAVSGWNGRPGPLRGSSPRRAFQLGLVAGLVYFIGTVYWTGTVVATFGEVPTPIAMFAMLLLAAYLALYPAIAALITGYLVSRMGARALLVAPFAWVATEFLRGYLFGGFPWVPLGNSQVTVLAVAQLASVLGVYGLSLLVALVNTGVAFSLVSAGRSRLTAGALVVVLLGGVGGWGALRVRDGALLREGEAIRVGLVQGNIDQEDKWKAGEARRIFTTYISMTRDVVKRGAQYVIWPESSTPFLFEVDQAGGAALRDLAREVGVPLLFGSDQIERSPDRMYNAAFLVKPDGQTGAVYRKMHLVPFGEFIPAKRWLYFVSPLVESLAEFAPGTEVVTLPVGNHVTSTAICYEVVYPSLIRQAVLDGSELLTTITNDGWYGNSSAPYQHFAMASMRAIEQGRYLARSANTGISGVVDPYGRVVNASRIFEQVGMVEEVRFLTSRTIYSRLGDVAAWVSLLVSALALGVARFV